MNDEIATLTSAVIEPKDTLRGAQAKVEPQPAEDWEFRNPGGSPVRRTEFLGDKSDRLVVHTVGKGCVYRTHRDDGFRGHAETLNDRAAFVICSNDAPKTVGAFAALTCPHGLYQCLCWPKSVFFPALLRRAERSTAQQR